MSVVFVNDRMALAARDQPSIDREGDRARDKQCNRQAFPEQAAIEPCVHRPGDDEHDRIFDELHGQDLVRAAVASGTTPDSRQTEVIKDLVDQDPGLDPIAGDAAKKKVTALIGAAATALIVVLAILMHVGVAASLLAVDFGWLQIASPVAYVIGSLILLVGILKVAYFRSWHFRRRTRAEKINLEGSPPIHDRVG